MIRTRIAPSPTGYPHIGTIYQALFDFAYARKNNGQFVVRIEDTDQGRLVDDAEEKIFSSFDWFGLIEDESVRKSGEYGPYRQSERLEIYKKYAQELIEKGHAYRCFCTRERLDEMRKKMAEEKKMPMYDKHCRTLPDGEVQKNIESKMPFVVRLAIPESVKVTIRDEIRGEIIFESNTIDDQVILKSDGFPTYHLAVVVDDHLMKITHVLRGEEWITSTPKHVLLYDFFEWEKPLFFHTPLLRNPDKSKLSKRHGHTSVDWYRTAGYLPDAILNFLALMGWSHPEEKEIFDLSEFISLFEMKDLKPVGPIFDLKKLEWMNGQYIMKLKDEDLVKLITNFYGDMFSQGLVVKTIPITKERIKTLADYQLLCEFFIKRPTSYETDISSRKDILVKIKEFLENISDWKAEVIGDSMMKCAKESGVKNGEFFGLLRMAITGHKVSPPLNESMEILGKEECMVRVDAVLNK